MPGQRIAHAELAFHPEIAERRTFVHESADVVQVGDPPHLCMARFVAPQDADFLGPQGVQEERRMGGRATTYKITVPSIRDRGSHHSMPPGAGSAGCAG